MSGLARIQGAFQSTILGGPESIRPELARTDEEDFDARLAAYTRGYRGRLVEALAVSYPALRAFLGDEAFERSMLDYIESTPSAHYSIRYYGAAVAQHLHARFEQEAGPVVGRVVGDIARWEWMLAEVFDAADDAPIDVSALAAISPALWSGVSFTFRSSLRRLSTGSNAVAWWRAASDEAPAPAGPEALPDTPWVLWRNDLRTLYRSLAADEATVLDLALGGAPFGTLCESLAAEVGVEQAPMRAATLLKAWFSEGLVAGVVSGVPDAS